MDKRENMEDQPISLALESNPENVKEIQPYVDRIVQKYQIGSDLYGNILISLTEAITNAIVHGNQADKSKKVFVNSQFDQNQIKVQIQDEGEGFDYEDVPDPTDPMNILTLNGRGVFLMHQLSDGVEFSNNGSTVEIKFKL